MIATMQMAVHSTFGLHVKIPAVVDFDDHDARVDALYLSKIKDDVMSSTRRQPVSAMATSSSARRI